MESERVNLWKEKCHCHCGHSAKKTQMELKIPENDFPGVKDALKGLGGGQGPDAPSSRRLNLLNPTRGIEDRAEDISEGDHRKK